MPRGDRDRHPQFGSRLHQRTRHDAELARGSVGQLPGRQQSPGDPAARRHRRPQDDRPHHGAGRRFVACRRSRPGQFHPDRPCRASRHQCSTSSGGALATTQAGGIFVAKVPNAKPAAAPAGCKALPAGHHRRVFFGLADYNNPNSFGLGYEEVDQNGVAVPGTQVPITQFDPSVTTVCLPLGPGRRRSTRSGSS